MTQKASPERQACSSKPTHELQQNNRTQRPSKKPREFGDSSTYEINIPFTRSNVLTELDIVVAYLESTTSTELGKTLDGETIITTTPSVNLLHRLIDAIRDLDSGVTHPVLSSNGIGGSARSTEHRKREASLIELVETVHKEFQFKTRSKAELEVAERLRKRNVTIKGQTATKESINSIIRHSPKLLEATTNRDVPRKRGRPKKQIKSAI